MDEPETLQVYDITTNLESNARNASNIILNSPIKKVSCGYEHACLLFENGQVTCLGGSDQAREAEIPEIFKSEIIDVHAGLNRTCVLKKGVVHCTGKSILK